MHHTKTKGDIGLVKVIADLTLKGYVPCIPLSEHQTYDLIAVSRNGKAFRLQVKYATLKRNGTIEVRFRRNWSDKNGTHTEHYSKDEFDYYAIYCQEKNSVLYVPNTHDCPKAIRFNRAANNQKKNVNWFKNYLDLMGASETIRCTPEMVKT